MSAPLMRNVLRTALAALAAIACAGFDVPPRVDYTLRPLMQGGALEAMQIELVFTGDSDGETELRLPSDWGGETELWRGVSDIVVVRGATMAASDDPSRRVLTHAPGARILVRYRVIQDWEGEPRAGRGNTYRPVIQPGYFHLIGEAALILPEIDGASPLRVRIEGLPRGWSFASDLESSGLLLAQANASISVGGDFRVLRASGDRSIRVAIRGNWGFEDDALVARVADIIASQREFFGGVSAPYLVTMLPLVAPEAGWLSVGGTGLDDAFAFFATRNVSEAQITRTLAHESLHSWIPARIGGMPSQGEAVDYWLSEGFTDFFTGRLLVRQGVWTPEDFAADLNMTLRDYALSSVRAAPNARIVEDFWNDREVQRLPYERGRLLASLWDFQLRQRLRDMDDVILEMRRRAAGRDPLRAAQMLPIVTQQYGLNIAGDIERFVELGAVVALPEDAFAPCGRIVTIEGAPFHRGFDIEATSANNNVIAGVDPTLPAYAAGLRDGMVLVRREAGEIGNAAVELAYVVRDGDSERTIRYMPRGHGVATMQRLELVTPLEGEIRAQCLRVLGG